MQLTDLHVGLWKSILVLQPGLWNLDTIILTDAEESPFALMLSTATDEKKWQGQGNCDDCLSKRLCPFFANAEMLRDKKIRRALLKLLRHGEMATGQRWNFRDAFSLCAELIVGQRADFRQAESGGSPCSWVHERANKITFGTDPNQKLLATWELAFHLYSQSLFPLWPDPSEGLDLAVVRKSALNQTNLEVFSQRKRIEGKQVRYLLAGTFSLKLDPSRATPPTSDNILRTIEDEFGQSVKQGLEALKDELHPLLEELLDLLGAAEAYWNESVRESSKVRAVIEYLRILSSTLVKRFFGVRNGHYLSMENLVRYEAILEDPRKLREIVQPLRSVLAPGQIFGGSLIRVFGQPSPDPAEDIIVTYQTRQRDSKGCIWVFQRAAWPRRTVGGGRRTAHSSYIRFIRRASGPLSGG